MSDFKTHITVSTTLGIGYAAVGYVAWDLPMPTCLLGLGLCSVSGMLPDLDSDSGVPLRESLCFAASAIPMLMIHRWEKMGMSHESLVLVGAGIYIFIRFVIGELLRRYTVHRGMFHSLPAAMIAGLIAFLICETDHLESRYFKAAAVFLGYLSHLVCDEINSLQLQMTGLRVKKSFGTAMKIYGPETRGNISCYAKLFLLTWFAINDPGWMKQLKANRPNVPQVADQPAASFGANNNWR